MNQKKTYRLLFASIILLGVAYWAFEHSGHESPEQTQVAPSASTSLPSQALTPTAPVFPKTASSNSDPLLENLKAISLPNSEHYRQSVEAHPHETPEDFLNFAENMSSHIERAVNDETYAPAVFAKLSGCALDSNNEKIPFATRAFCLWNSERIAHAHPQAFAQKLREVASQVPARVRSITARLDR